MAIYYDNEKLIVNKFGKNVKKLDNIEISKIKNEYPNIVPSYLTFLKEVGYGDIIKNRYKIYSGLVKPDDIYDNETAKTLSNFLIFGDDYQGYCFGFDINNWFVMEFDPARSELKIINKNFYDFITDLISSAQ